LEIDAWKAILVFMGIHMFLATVYVGTNKRRPLKSMCITSLGTQLVIFLSLLPALVVGPIWCQVLSS